MARLTALLSLLALAAAAPARAEDFKAPLTVAKPAFAWAGHGVGLPGFECSNMSPFRCDTVLFSLEVAGDLAVAIDVEGEQINNPTGAAAYPNFDLYLFATDAGGAKTGDAIAEGVTPIDDEKLEAKGLAAGSYLLEVRSDESIGEDYTGKAKLSGFAAPAIAPSALPPAPAAKPKRKPSAKARCRAKAKRIRNRRKRARALKRCSKVRR